MKQMKGAWGFLFVMILFSCNDSGEGANHQKVAINKEDSFQEMKHALPVLNSDSMIAILQGKWRETEYPFRVADFKAGKVKLIEEGVVEAPTFKEYKISKTCPFDVNNIKNAGNNDVFLVMSDNRTCEIVKVSNDTLTLSGYNISAGSNYSITYKKVK